MSSFTVLTVLLLMHAIESLISNSNSVTTDSSSPNIIFILTDDWGINDVGWTNDNTDTQTPFLDNLAKNEGLILSNYYAERVCTATRASFLTGRYPSRYGLQAGVFHENIPYSLTRQVSLLSNEFQQQGYNTHIIGKWHLGFQAYEYTPTYRGFDSFYGYWNGGESYFSHLSSCHYPDSDDNTIVASHDLHINELPAMNNPYDGVYGVWWQRDEALKLLQSKITSPLTATTTDSKPFLFYFALQASHNPREAPDEYNEKYLDGPWGDDYNRYTFKAQTTSVDDAINDIITFIKQSNLWDNTLIVIASDNGGKYGMGDNAPYRGFKNTSWEGGVKVAGFVTGGYLNDDRKGKTMDYSMHITDWYSTLLSAAGKKVNYQRSTRLHDLRGNLGADTRWTDVEDTELDGIDMWSYIQAGVEGDDYFLNEREILLDLNDVWCEHSSCGALKIGRFKYLRGNNIASLLPDYDDGDLWYRDFALDKDNAESFCVQHKEEFMTFHGLTEDDMNDGDDDEDSMINSIGCQLTDRGCLFDLELDPCEYYDLSSLKPDLVQTFQNRLDEFEQEATVPLMDENLDNKILAPEEINPRLVCKNIFYWCPYQRYDDVSFEYQLLNDDDYQHWDTQQSALPFNIALYFALWISMCLGLYVVVKHYKSHKKGYFIDQNNDLSLHEFTPLISR